MIKGFEKGLVKYVEGRNDKNFILNMKKTNQAFDLKEIKRIDVVNYFKEVGAQLRE